MSSEATTLICRECGHVRECRGDEALRLAAADGWRFILTKRAEGPLCPIHAGRWVDAQKRRR